MVDLVMQENLFFQVLCSLYITGWIGWSGRSYLQFAKKTDKPNENEIIINVPVAIGMMSASFLWPLAAWKELVSGELLSTW